MSIGLKNLGRICLLSLLVLGLNTVNVYGDGTEELGAPTISIAEGTSIQVAGIGLEAVQPGSIELTVPAGNNVEQVILYWSGFYSAEVIPGSETMAITVDGNPVVGDLIGGITPFFGNNFAAAYRKDITSLGLVQVGANSISIGGLSFDSRNHGAGILVILDDGSDLAEIGVFDGADTAFINFPDPRRITVAKTYTFAPSANDRTAQLAIFAGSVSPEDLRPNLVKVTIPNELDQNFPDMLNSLDGLEWDSLMLEVNVPANAEEVTVQVLSEDFNNTGALPASLVWIGSTLSILPEVECTGKIGNLVWKDEAGNCDGLQDSNDMPLAGVTVYLKDSNDVVLASTVTDANGVYLFEGLCADDYVVEVDESTLPDDLKSAPNKVGDDESVDSNGSPEMVVLDTDSSENLTIDFGYCEKEEGGEGCTPGYWKQRHHFDSWVTYEPGDVYDDVFGVDVFGDMTLLEVLKQGGGGAKALGRHSVAALLNAATGGVGYLYSESDVITLVQVAFGNGTDEAISILKDDLEEQNELGCPLN